MLRFTWAAVPVLGLATIASAATFDSVVGPLNFDDGQGTTGEATVELLDPADPSLDGLWVNSNLVWEFDLDFIGPVTGSISIVNFEISDYGVDSNNFTRVLGLTWDYIPSGDIADFQVIFMQGLKYSTSNFITNSLNSSDPTYPFDQFALSNNFGWVVPGPDMMEDRRYLIFARPVLDSNNDPVLGTNGLPTIQIADVILMSLDATLTPVPEPASLGLLALGSSMMLIRRKRA